MGKWATVTITDSDGQRYSLDVKADSSFDAAHLYLVGAQSKVTTRAPLPIPSLGTVFEVVVEGKVYKVTGKALQKWILKQRAERKGPNGLLFSRRPILGP